MQEIYFQIGKDIAFRAGKAEYMALYNKTAAERIKEKAGIPEIRYLCF